MGFVMRPANESGRSSAEIGASLVSESVRAMTGFDSGADLLGSIVEQILP